jgi:protein-tyrosine phosphatase
MAFKPFRGMVFKPFRDASNQIVSSFDCTILDCLEGLEHAIKHDWFDWKTFDLASYDFYSRLEQGDMNWIIPKKFIAFTGPSPIAIDRGCMPPTCTPEDNAKVFKKFDCRLVVRLNKKQYDRNRFLDQGIKHVDLYFKDGSCPTQDIITKFLHISEQEPGPVAVHCKAGLGRTGTLIGLYAMKHNNFPARAYIGWSRLCRPGCILGPQQQFLVSMERSMFQQGQAARGPQVLPSGIHRVPEPMPFVYTAAETAEDVGQGERLCQAKLGLYLHSAEDCSKAPAARYLQSAEDCSRAPRYFQSAEEIGSPYTMPHSALLSRALLTVGSTRVVGT